MYVLNRFPTAEIKPQSFIEGSKSQLDSVLRKVISHYAPNKSLDDMIVRPVQHPMRHFGDPVVAEWVDFALNKAPLDDNAENYCTSQPLRIPFHSHLFVNDDTVFSAQPLLESAEARARIPDSEALDSVLWSRRGVKRKTQMLARRAYEGSDSDDSGEEKSDIDSDVDDFNYKTLTESQKDRYKSLLKFRDTDESGDWFEAIVEDVVMETAMKVPCFKYFECGKDDEPQYIIAASALSDCEWVHVENE